MVPAPAVIIIIYFIYLKLSLSDLDIRDAASSSVFTHIIAKIKTNKTRYAIITIITIFSND